MNYTYFLEDKFKIKNNCLYIDNLDCYEDFTDISYLGLKVSISKKLIDDLINDDGVYALIVQLQRTSSTHLIINDKIFIPLSVLSFLLKESIDQRSKSISNLSSYDIFKKHYYGHTYIYDDYKVLTSELIEMLDFDEEKIHMFLEGTLELSYHKDIMIKALNDFMTKNFIYSKYDMSSKYEVIKQYNLDINLKQNETMKTKFNYKIFTYNTCENLIFNYMKMCSILDNPIDIYKEVIAYLSQNNILYHLENRELHIDNLYIDLNYLTIKNNISLTRINECILGIVAPKNINVLGIYEKMVTDHFNDISFYMSQASMTVQNKIDIKKCLAIFIKAISKKNISGLNVIEYIKCLKKNIFRNYEGILVYAINAKNYNVDVLIITGKSAFYIDNKITKKSIEEAILLKEKGVLC